MPSLSFTIKNKKNKGLIVNDRELLTLYFYGINVVNQQGTGISSESLDTYIRNAQRGIEKTLGIKFFKKIIIEQSDYFRDEFNGTGFVKTNFPVNYPIELTGWMGVYRQLAYPKEWLTVNKSENTGYARQIIVVPNSNTNTVALNAALFAGSAIPYLGLVNSSNIGSYWHKKYITGFEIDGLPYDLLNVVCKMAAINVLQMLGDIILGQGISSQSLSMDGLSQSMNTTASANGGAFGGRISNYKAEIAETLKEIRGMYKGITLTAI
jgi:hypothetical protein